MDIERTRGLTFLLSFAALPMAGCPAGDDDATTNVSTDSTGNETSNGTNNESTVSNATTVSTSMDTSTTLTSTTDPSTDPSATDEATHGDTDESTSSSGTTGSDSSSSGTAESSSEGTTGAYVDPLCAAYAAKIVECYPKYAEYESYYAAYCMKGLMYFQGYSMECGMAFEEALSCIGMADCADLAGMAACVEEQTAMDMLCGGGGSSSSGASDAGDMGGAVEGG